MTSSDPHSADRRPTIAFLFTKVRTGASISRNHFYGMYELRDHGFKTGYLEIEQFLPRGLCAFLRRFILTMHFAHLPLFPLFFRSDAIVSSTGYASLVLKRLLGIRSFKWIMLDFNILGTIGARTTLKQKLFAWAVEGADGIVTISEAEKKGLEKTFPRLRGRVEFIHEATDMDLFDPAAAASTAGRLPGALSDGYILSVGTYGRDFGTLVEAVKGMKDPAGKDVRLIIATKPERVAHLQPLPPNVTARFYPAHEMPALYAGAVVCAVVPAPQGEYDSVGTLALGESFAMGKATVVTRTPSMESYVEDGVNAVFVPAHDVQALRTSIEDLLNNAEIRRRIGQRARQFALEHLTLRGYASRLAPFLHRIISSL